MGDTARPWIRVCFLRAAPLEPHPTERPCALLAQGLRVWNSGKGEGVYGL